MNYRDFDIKPSYISHGDHNIASAFLNPLLRITRTYKRSVGFFSSGVFIPILEGIQSFARNGGKIKLIASPQLTESDIQAIQVGYEKRDIILKDAFSRSFIDSLEEFDDIKLQLLVELIANEILDIKIAVVDSIGEYHDKLGILEDFDGNKIVFYGSANSSINGYKNNYEKIRTCRSWIAGDEEHIVDENKEFDNLWDGLNPFVEVFDYQESAKKNILKVIQNRKEHQNNQNVIVLRDYQEEAISKWVANGYKGFYVMATGTGKTWTAIFSAKELLKMNDAMIVICAPYKHLVKQWSEDVANAFPSAKVILVSSENQGWDTQIKTEFIRKKYDKNAQIIIISTIMSFNMDRFTKLIDESRQDKLLIVDEAHRFTKRPEYLKKQYKYLLGLSATPFSGKSSKNGNELLDFFGGAVFELPIELALKRKFLVPYNYHPIYVTASEEEENRFKSQTKKILSCFKNNRCINSDLLVKSLRNRLRIISMAEEKMERLDDILMRIKTSDHFVVYCGDGKLFDQETGKELRHIQAIKRALSEHGYKSSQFTAQENMKERMELVDSFNRGDISALAAIRCLDEGINIPSIKSALILSSNDDYREFVQRRGRILRTYKDKECADIYDVVVLPSHDLDTWAKIELRRFYEYGKLALNWESLEHEFEKHLADYNLTKEDVDIYDYTEVEEPLDE